jgi:hypothetical protein
LTPGIKTSLFQLATIDGKAALTRCPSPMKGKTYEDYE